MPTIFSKLAAAAKEAGLSTQPSLTNSHRST
jgi:hypothetical protein